METSNSTKLILIVEDEPTNAEIARIICERLGYQTLTAADGVEAIRMAKQRPVDLILMDILLPIKDGLEATRELKADPETTGIPVIAVSARASLQHRQEMLDAGMVDAIIKPYRSHELLDCIQKWLN